MNKFFNVSIVLLLGVAGNCVAQGNRGNNSVTSQNQYGNYMAEKTTENVVGSPFISDNWKDATIKMSDGRLLKDFEVKYNLLDDLLYFKSSDGKFMTFTDPVSEFKFTGAENSRFKNGFNNPKYGNKKTFYQVLYDGQVQLLKRMNKAVSVVQSYNDPSPVKNIIDAERYYVAMNDGSLTEFKRNKKALLAFMKDKSAEVNTFLTSKKIDLNKDDELISVFEYYNSIL